MFNSLEGIMSLVYNAIKVSVYIIIWPLKVFEDTRTKTIVFCAWFLFLFVSMIVFVLSSAG